MISLLNRLSSTLYEKAKRAIKSRRPLFIDAENRVRKYSVEELSQTAEQYFAQIKTPQSREFHLTKPFGSLNEAPDLLISFGHLLGGMKLKPGMTVLDFAAGSCWASRFINQMGCKVICLDVSTSGLDLGKQLFATLPVIGSHPSPSFLHFDGHRIDLADESVDRTFCFDAFHHIPNQEEVLKEIYRVLKKGGIAAFSEPGPYHSLAPVSQSAMQEHKVLERDIDVNQIWKIARGLGFSNIELAVYNSRPFILSLRKFYNFLFGGIFSYRYARATREFSKDRRMFYLSKGQPELDDSSTSQGLVADIKSNPRKIQTSSNQAVAFEVVIKNTGTSVWLPSQTQTGGVNLGCHLLKGNGEVENWDYYRHLLSNHPIYPNKSIELSFSIKMPAESGSYFLELDLVSENVIWFGQGQSKTVRIPMEITDK